LKKITKILLLGTAVTIVASCTCGVPLKVTPIQRSDKKLTCKDVILEINESEQYRQEAANAKGISAGEILAPICWINGAIDGADAIKAANARIDYLGHIYDLMDCGGDGTGTSDAYKKESAKPLPPPPPPLAKPAPEPKKPAMTNMTPAEKDMVDVDEANKRGKFHDYYKELGGDLHAHMDARGKIYIHSHRHKGPHRHLEDQIKE
jgi:hypothetical protein